MQPKAMAELLTIIAPLPYSCAAARGSFMDTAHTPAERSVHKIRAST
jgi:hypothetical protein